MVGPVRQGATDPAIRAVLRNELERIHGDGALILNELQLEHFRAFADVAAINGRIDAYEIKSDADRLDRLPRQVCWYASVCDRVTLVAAERHIERASDSLPGWWGLVIALPVADGIVLSERRAAGENPDRNVRAVLNLLRKSELLRILRTAGANDSLWRLDKGDAIDAVQHALGREAHAVALRVLRFRRTWTTRQLGLSTEDERLAHARRQADPLICLATNGR
jgi:hypothetical protein